LVSSAPGMMRFVVESKPIGVTVKPESGDLKAGEKTVLKIEAGKNAAPGTLNVRIDPTGTIIPIRVAIH
jgi:hypothetical protein